MLDIDVPNLYFLYHYLCKFSSLNVFLAQMQKTHTPHTQTNQMHTTTTTKTKTQQQMPKKTKTTTLATAHHTMSYDLHTAC